MSTRGSDTATEPRLSSNTRFQRTTTSWVLGRFPLELAPENSPDPRLLGERLAVATVLEDHLREHGLPDTLRGTLPPGADASELMGEHRDDLAREWHAVGDAAAYRVAVHRYTGRGFRNLASEDAEALKESVAVASELRMEWVVTAPREPASRPEAAARPGGGWAAARVDELVSLPGRPAMMTDRQWEAENRAVDQDGKAADKDVWAARQAEAAERTANADERKSWRAGSGANQRARTKINELGEKYRDFAEQEAETSAAEHGPWYVRAFSGATPRALTASTRAPQRGLATVRQGAQVAGIGLHALPDQTQETRSPVPESARAFLRPGEAGKTPGRLPAAALNTSGLPDDRTYSSTMARQFTRGYRPRGAQPPRAHGAEHSKEP
ncbi:hypothetical protein [Embleya sp. NBC_00896]|uniref:hypothetical protein n=1 Tax=Embleya sp. NBC_00896 TaxID=2975961 RepID=UPI002F90B5B0|nr:hypothetical protein OG928_38485 [Embleya sp. NBC_00896]